MPVAPRRWKTSVHRDEWTLENSGAAFENLVFQSCFSSRLLNYHRKSWKLHDCHKLPASLKNGTFVCCWMGRMGRTVMGLWDNGTAPPVLLSRYALRTRLY